MCILFFISYFLSCRCSNDYKKATGYFNDKTGEFEQPDWIHCANSNVEFKPSSNLAPTEAIPVLISGTHCDNESEQILQPMIWSLIPKWHKVIEKYFFEYFFNYNKKCVVVLL